MFYVLPHFAETAARHPTLSATAIAFEEGLSVTVSRHLPSSLLFSPTEIETVTLDRLRAWFQA